MPTQEEITALSGEQQPSESQEVVSVDEYRKALQSNEELRKLMNKRDDEIREARELKKKLEEQASSTENPLGDEEDDIDTKIAKALASQEEKIRSKVEYELKLTNKVEQIQKEVKSSMESYPYVKESELVTFLGRNPDFTVDKAVKALYPDEYFAHKTNGTIPETDQGRRTLQVGTTPSTDDGTQIRRGFGGTGGKSGFGSLANVISSNIQKRLDSDAGVR